MRRHIDGRKDDVLEILWGPSVATRRPTLGNVASHLGVPFVSKAIRVCSRQHERNAEAMLLDCPGRKEVLGRSNAGC